MKLSYTKGGDTILVFDNDELVLAYSILLAIEKQCSVKKDETATAAMNDMAAEMKRRQEHHAIAERYRICYRCYKEIDLSVDKYYHTKFGSGFEMYYHQSCPAVNKGPGYLH